MSPRGGLGGPLIPSFPRVSGDEPYIQTCVQVAAEFSPRERG